MQYGMKARPYLVALVIGMWYGYEFRMLTADDVIRFGSRL